MPLVMLTPEEYMWIVVYAKVIDDKENGISLAGVFFGGIADNRQLADKIARECVNTIKGGTIMPRLYQSNDTHQLPKIMREAEEAFSKKMNEMKTASAILSRPAKRK